MITEPSIASGTPKGTSNRRRRSTEYADARPRVALITTVPSIFKVLSCGKDAYKLSRQSITPYSIRKFLSKNDIHNVDATLYFVPALFGSWTQYDPSFRMQIRNALKASRPYDLVINLCQAIPLYRRSKLDERGKPYKLSMPEVDRFIETLAGLAALSRQIEGRYFEPLAMDRGSYTFRPTNSGAPTIMDMRVSRKWIKKDQNSILRASGSAEGINHLSQLSIPDTVRFAGEKHDSFASWFKELGMKSLNHRFICSDYQWDFDADQERVWELDREFTAAGKRLLYGVDDVQMHTIPRFLEGKSKAKLEAAVRADAGVGQKLDMLRSAIGDTSSLKMLDISTLLKLSATGAMNSKVLRDDLLSLFARKFPFTVAFQQMWDRQCNLYTQKELNEKINAWYVVNSLLHAKEQLNGDVDRFVVWAFPTMPTDTVRFFLDPEVQQASLKSALISGLSKLEVKRKTT